MDAQDPALGRIRARQHEAIDRLIPPMMIANVVCAGAFTLLMLDQHPFVLLVWWGLVTLVSAARLRMALHRNAKPTRYSLSLGAVRRSSLQAAGMGTCLVSVPAWLLSQTSGANFAVVVCLLTGFLWAGGLLLATVLPAAVTYIALVTAFTTAGLLFAEWSAAHAFLAFLFLAGATTAIRSVRRQSEQFDAAQGQRYELERQREVIGVLLKDYEEQTSDWLWETDAQLRCRHPSERFAQALGQPASSIDGAWIGDLLTDKTTSGNAEARQTLRALKTARSTFRDVIVPLTLGGEARWWSISGRPTFDEYGAFTGYRGVCADISTAKRAEARVSHLAHHDALTGLPNRSHFHERLAQSLHGRGRGKLAVLSLDLDGFKAVNDRYGHAAGDALLVAVTARLRSQVLGVDMIARFGGDEFVVLDASVLDEAEIEGLAQRLIDVLSAPFPIAEEEVVVGVSIGVAFAPTDGDTPEALLAHADAALYRAKVEGRGTVRFFAPEMDRQLQERQRLVQDLRSAVAHDELVLHYQPFVSARTGAVSGCEALLRWRHPTLGMISPAEFIPLAEASGLIIPIGAWIIEQACREAAGWPSAHRVAVNISPVQFRNRELPRVILGALTRSGLAPGRLEVEVTEATLIEDADAALDILRQIRGLGVRVALDDFGTGYSSLSYLRRYPFDKIKIDRSFVHELPTRRDHQVIVQAIRDMAHGLGMTITAEGVETEAQAEQLRATGCEELQGYLYSRPKAAEDLGLGFAGLAQEPIAQAI